MCLETVVSWLDMTVSWLDIIVSWLDMTFLLDGNIQKRGCATTGFAGTLSPVSPVVAHPLRECHIVRSGLQKLVELCLKVALGDGTYVLAYEFATLEEQQCRNVAYAILCCYVVVLLNVALAYYYLAVVFLGEL